MADIVYDVSYIDAGTGVFATSDRTEAARRSGDMTGLTPVETNSLAPIHFVKRADDLAPTGPPPAGAVWAWDDQAGLPLAVPANEVIAGGSGGSGSMMVILAIIGLWFLFRRR